MISTHIFSQRDYRWAADRHGTSGFTLGETGCTVTIVASMLLHAGYDTDPGRLNELLTNNQGYASGNLIIWTAITRLFPRVKFVYRYYNYDDNIAKIAISRNNMALIEVSGGAIGGSPGGKHWVGAIGEGKTADPWIGSTRDMSFWTPTGMAIFEYKAARQGEFMPDMYGNPNQYDLSNRESMKVAVDHLNLIQTGQFVRKSDADKKAQEEYERGKKEGTKPVAPSRVYFVIDGKNISYKKE